MSLNKIKINQLDFDISQIALSVGSGSFVSNETLTASSGALRSDISNQASLINQLSTSGSLTSDRLSSLSGSCVFTTGDQTIRGSKTFDSRPLMNGTGFLLRGEVSFENVNNLIYNTGNQDISGIKRFFSKPTLNGTGFVFSNETGSFIASGDLRLNHHTLLLVTGAGQPSVNGYYYKTSQLFSSKNIWGSITSQQQRIVWQASLGWCIEDFLQGGIGWVTRYRQIEPSPDSSVYANIEPPDINRWFPHTTIYPGVSPAPSLFWTKSTFSSNNKDINFFKLTSGSDSSVKFGLDGNFVSSDITVKFKNKNGTVVLNNDFPVYATGVQTISGVKTFDSIPTYKGSELIYSGSSQSSGHNHSTNQIQNLDQSLSGKLSVLSYPSVITISNSTPVSFESVRNSILDFRINHPGQSVVNLPRPGVPSPPINGDQILLQFFKTVPTVSETVIKTGNSQGQFSDFYTLQDGIGGVSVFYANSIWNIRSTVINHSQTHSIGGVDPIQPLNIGAAPRQDFASFEWIPPGFNFVKATGFGSVDGVRHNNTPANYIPFNNTKFNTNTGIFELINPNNAVTNYTMWSGVFYGITGSRVKITQNGIYEFSVSTHFYDSTGNCDFYLNLVKTNGSQSSFWQHLTTLVDERYDEKKSDRLKGGTYIYQKLNNDIEYFTATIVSNCDGTDYTNWNVIDGVVALPGQGLFPSDDGHPFSRMQIKKLM